MAQGSIGGICKMHEGRYLRIVVGDDDGGGGGMDGPSGLSSPLTNSAAASNGDRARIASSPVTLRRRVPSDQTRDTGGIYDDDDDEGGDDSFLAGPRDVEGGGSHVHIDDSSGRGPGLKHRFFNARESSGISGEGEGCFGPQRHEHSGIDSEVDDRVSEDLSDDGSIDGDGDHDDDDDDDDVDDEGEEEEVVIEGSRRRNSNRHAVVSGIASKTNETRGNLSLGTPSRRIDVNESSGAGRLQNAVNSSGSMAEDGDGSLPPPLPLFQFDATKPEAHKAQTGLGYDTPQPLNGDMYRLPSSQGDSLHDVTIAKLRARFCAAQEKLPGTFAGNMMPAPAATTTATAATAAPCDVPTTVVSDSDAGSQATASSATATSGGHVHAPLWIREEVVFDAEEERSGRSTPERSPSDKHMHLRAEHAHPGAREDPLRFESHFESGNLGKAAIIHGKVTYGPANTVVLDEPSATSATTASVDGAGRGVGQVGRKAGDGKVTLMEPVDQEYNLWCSNDTATRGNIQWYFFSACNNKQQRGLRVRFNIVNMMKKDSLYNYGMRVCVFSSKEHEKRGVGWERGGDCIAYHRNRRMYSRARGKRRESRRHYYTLTFTYTFKHPGDQVFLCHCYPFTYSDLQQDLLALQLDGYARKFVRRRSLCTTLAGNRCELITITEPSDDVNQVRARRAVVISSRVHPGESNSSHMMRGVLDFLSSDHYIAVRLRKCFVFKLVPMLNPDGVINGNYRSDLMGQDLNRRFSDPDSELQSTIYSMKELLRETHASRGVFMFIDMHGHSRKKNVFFYGCDAHTPATMAQQARAKLASEDAASTSPAGSAQPPAPAPRKGSTEPQPPCATTATEPVPATNDASHEPQASSSRATAALSAAPTAAPIPPTTGPAEPPQDPYDPPDSCVQPRVLPLLLSQLFPAQPQLYRPQRHRSEPPALSSDQAQAHDQCEAESDPKQDGWNSLQRLAQRTGREGGGPEGDVRAQGKPKARAHGEPNSCGGIGDGGFADHYDGPDDVPQLFSYRDSTFNVHRSKWSTGRVVAWRELGIHNAFTMEASFCGSGDNREQRSGHRVDLQKMRRKATPLTKPGGKASNVPIAPAKGTSKGTCQEVGHHYSQEDLEAAGRNVCIGLAHYVQVITTPEQEELRVAHTSQRVGRFQTQPLPTAHNSAFSRVEPSTTAPLRAPVGVGHQITRIRNHSNAYNPTIGVSVMSQDLAQFAAAHGSVRASCEIHARAVLRAQIAHTLSKLGESKRSKGPGAGKGRDKGKATKGTEESRTPSIAPMSEPRNAVGNAGPAAALNSFCLDGDQMSELFDCEEQESDKGSDSDPSGDNLTPKEILKSNVWKALAKQGLVAAARKTKERAKKKARQGKTKKRKKKGPGKPRQVACPSAASSRVETAESTKPNPKLTNDEASRARRNVLSRKKFSDGYVRRKLVSPVAKKAALIRRMQEFDTPTEGLPDISLARQHLAPRVMSIRLHMEDTLHADARDEALSRAPDYGQPLAYTQQQHRQHPHGGGQTQRQVQPTSQSAVSNRSNRGALAHATGGTWAQHEQQLHPSSTRVAPFQSIRTSRLRFDAQPHYHTESQATALRGVVAPSGSEKDVVWGRDRNVGQMLRVAEPPGAAIHPQVGSGHPVTSNSAASTQADHEHQRLVRAFRSSFEDIAQRFIAGLEEDAPQPHHPQAPQPGAARRHANAQETRVGVRAPFSLSGADHIVGYGSDSIRAHRPPNGSHRNGAAQQVCAHPSTGPAGALVNENHSLAKRFQSMSQSSDPSHAHAHPSTRMDGEGGPRLRPRGDPLLRHSPIARSKRHTHMVHLSSVGDSDQFNFETAFVGMQHGPDGEFAEGLGAPVSSRVAEHAPDHIMQGPSTVRVSETPPPTFGRRYWRDAPVPGRMEGEASPLAEEIQRLFASKDSAAS